jgi:hypothetical protein
VTLGLDLQSPNLPDMQAIVLKKYYKLQGLDVVRARLALFGNNSKQTKI